MTDLIVDFGKRKQGSTPIFQFVWPLLAGDSPDDLTGYTLSATMKNADSLAVTAVTGDVTVVDGATRLCQWDMSATDLGTAGSFGVTLVATDGSRSLKTLYGSLVVEDDPAVNAVSGDPLVGVSGTDAAALAEIVGSGVDTSDLETETGAQAKADAAQAAAISVSIAKTRTVSDPSEGIVSHGDDFILATTQKSVIVSFCLDDGQDDTYLDAFPLFQAQGEVFTCGIITDNIDQSGSVTTAQIQEIHGAGFEIASHSTDNDRLTIATLGTAAAIEANISDAKTVLQNIIGTYVPILVWPGGEKDDTSIRLAQKYHRAAVGVSSGEFNDQPVEQYSTKRQNLDTANLATAQGWVDDARLGDYWLVFMVHPGQATWAAVLAFLDDLIDYIQAASVPIVTISDGLDLYGNLHGAYTITNVERNYAIGNEGDLYFRGRHYSFGVNALDGSELPESSVFHHNYASYSSFNTTGGGDLPSGEGVLVHYNYATQANNYYSSHQVYIRRGELWKRFEASGGGWNDWVTVEKTYREFTKSVGATTINAHDTYRTTVYATSPNVLTTGYYIVTAPNDMEDGLVCDAVKGTGNGAVVLRIINTTAANISMSAHTFSFVSLQPV